MEAQGKTFVGGQKESRFKIKIVSETGDIAIKLTEVKMIIRDHYEKYYMPTNGEPKNDKFLETYNLPRLNHAEGGNLRRTCNIAVKFENFVACSM